MSPSRTGSPLPSASAQESSDSPTLINDARRFSKALVKKRSRAFVYSFLITFFSLAGLAFFLYTNSEPVQVSHLPSNIPPYHPVWGKYVPSDAVYVSFVNYTMITSTNSSLPPPGELVRLSSPRLTINQSDVRFLVEVTLATPNVTLDVVFLKPSSFTTLTNTFDGQGVASF